MKECQQLSVSEWLVGDVIVFLFPAVDELDRIRVLPSCERLFLLLVGYEWLNFIDIITFMWF
jgi:hypothetical protein